MQNGNGADSQQPTPPQSSDHVLKGILYTILAFVLLFGGAAAGYWYGTKSAKPQPETQNQEEQAPLQWKIYRDKNSRFSFRYPSYLDDSDLIDYQYFDIIKFTEPYPDVDLIIKVVSKGLSKIDTRPADSHSELTEEVVRLGQSDFVKVSYYWIIEGVPHTVKSHDYFVGDKDLTVIFSLAPSLEADRDPAAYKDAVDLTEQILSTFEFLD